MTSDRAEGDRVGLVDGSVESDSRSCFVVLEPHAVVQLDEVVAIPTVLPDGRQITHYGIVVETFARLEGADLPSDTARVGDQVLPAELVRRVELRILRTHPEVWVEPEPGAVVHRALGADRALALFEDQMEAMLPVGLDLSGAPVHADVRFLDGRAGGHVSISGISGVATKTSYALFLLYQLFETARGMELLGGRGAVTNTRALVFNTKGEDLLHLDRPNSRFAGNPDAAAQWAALGVDDPAPFSSVRLYAPRRDTDGGAVVPDVRSRPTGEVAAYGWTPEAFVREQLLQFCFTSDDDRTTQVGFVEQQVRLQLLRHAGTLIGSDDGTIVIAHDDDPRVPFNPDRLAVRSWPELTPDDGRVVRGFGDLIDLIEEKIELEDDRWLGRTQSGTQQAFLRRLVRLRRRIGPLVAAGVEPVRVEDGGLVHVVDISRLHDDAQRFVVGALLERVWASKQGTGREPLRFVVLDELNKYAPAHGFSPLRDLLVDIAERGRSLGVLLIGAQQAASAVAPALPRNAALKVAGRLDAGEADAYRFLTPKLRERATRFLPGTMVVDQPLVPEPLPVRFPFPPYATNPDEAAAAEGADRRVAASTARIAARGGPEPDL